jgi:hypothetical protein
MFGRGFDSHRPLHMDAFRSFSIRAISHFRRSILARSCRDSETRLVSQKRRFPGASMTGQSFNPEQPRGRGATRPELGTKSNEETNLAPTYSEYGFLENVNRRGQKSGSPMPAAHFASAARFQLPRINSPGTCPPSLIYAGIPLGALRGEISWSDGSYTF